MNIVKSWNDFWFRPGSSFDLAWLRIVLVALQCYILLTYSFPMISYVLALPATGIVLAGIGAFCFSRASDARRRVALAFLGVCILAYGLAVLVMTLRLPFYAQAKSSYALSVVAPVSVAAAHSFAWLHAALSVPERRWLRVLLHAWAGAFAIVVVLAFCG